MADDKSAVTDMPEETAPKPAAEVAALQQRGVATPKWISAGDVMALWRWKLKDPEEQGLRNFIKEIRLDYEMLRPVPIPNEYKAITNEIRTPFIRDAAQRWAASLVKDPPIRQFEQRDDSIMARDSASIASIWVNAICDGIQKLNPADDINYNSALYLVRDSETVLKTVHRPDAWANFPKREDGERGSTYTGRARKAAHGVVNPFASRVVDRLQMIFGDGEYGDEWCIEYGTYPVPYLAQRYGWLADEVAPVTKLGGIPRPEEYGTTGVYANRPGIGGAYTLKLEYFDAEQWAVIINGQMAYGFPKENPYAPFLPYQRAVSFPTLYAMRYLVRALDALLTMKMNWSYLSAYPVPVMEALAQADLMMQQLPVGDNGEPSPQEIQKWKPGKEHFLPPGYTMKFLEPPSTGASLDQMIAELRELVDIAGIPSIMRGSAQGSRQPGYGINQLMAAANLFIRQLGSALSRQEEMRAELLMHMVKQTIGQEVYVLGNDGDQRRWVGMRPKGDLTKDLAAVDTIGPAKVTFRPILPTDEQANEMTAIQLVNAPKQILSLETVLKEKLQKEDVGSELKRIFVENELRDPDLVARIRTAALLKAHMPVSQPQATPPSVTTPNNPGTMPNDATNGGEPSIPNLTMPVVPNAPLPDLGNGGRTAGSFPGQPAGQGR